jgi:hypothetical protein
LAILLENTLREAPPENDVPDDVGKPGMREAKQEVEKVRMQYNPQLSNNANKSYRTNTEHYTWKIQLISAFR